MSNTKPQPIPTGSYIIVGQVEDDGRIKTGYCRITEFKDIPTQEQIEKLCIVKRVSRAKVFDSFAHATEWKNKKHAHSDVVKGIDLSIKEIMVM